MAEDSEKIPLCLGMSLGMTLNISFEGLGSFRSTLIGMEQDAYIIVKLPPMPDIPSKLFQKNHIVVRYFHDGNAYGFRSTLTGLVKEPYRLHFLAYPDSVESLNLRKSQRHICLIPAHIGIKTLEGGKMDLRGVISDISVGGCSFECTDNGDGMGEGVAIGRVVRIFFRFPNEEAWRTILAEIRTLRSDRNKVVLGLQYQIDPHHETEVDTLGIIQAFIDYLHR